ncbi:MAG TPA: sigma-70 family RNA polymerase sigma factor [Candidatus Polarisedimenticolia bacterium]|nr:sigma-70 family RNA polymerase sigma factor [Candidatus Polarisedimenticolia bacterium]
MQRPEDEFIPTRATLIHRLKNWQDQASWQDFFDTYWKLIYGLARKFGLNEEDAQDIVQDTMVAVANKMPSFQYDPAIGSFKSWLRNLIRWRIADLVRKRGGVTTLPLQPPGEDDQTPIDPPDTDSKTIDQLYEREWQKNLLDAAVDKVKRKLDPQKYQVFDCYVNKEWPPEKVAEVFKISVDQVYMAKHRITEMIKSEAKRLETEML